MIRTLMATAAAGLTVLLAAGQDLPEPLSRAVEERHVVRAEVRKLAEKLVHRTNKAAEEFDAKTYIDSARYPYAIFFVPKPPPPERDVIQDSVPDFVRRPPPADAVKREWTDEFALARQYSFRCALGRIVRVSRANDLDVPYKAEVEVTIDARQRTGLASKVQPAPTVPEGMQIWSSGFRFFGTGGGAKRPAVLWYPSMPGRARPPATALEQKALKAMTDSKEVRTRATLTCEMIFDARKGAWRVSDLKRSPNWPHPRGLSRKMGLPKEIAPWVYCPGQFKKQASTKPSAG